MKYVLLYKKADKNIIMQQIMPAGTRPIYNTAIYEMVEFETEAEMLAYIAENELIAKPQEVENEL
mgnify:FL=1|jgi:heat shock protein HspQ